METTFYKDASAEIIASSIAPSAKVYRDTYIRNCTIGYAATIGDRSRIIDSSIDEHVVVQRGNLITGSSIGRYTSTMHNTSVFYSQIGSFCAISWSCSIGGAAHDYERATIHGFISCRDFGIIDENADEDDYYSKPVVIGNDVWIATGACINRGITIGNGAVVGANSVVTKDVEPYTIVGGCPARPIKLRFSEDWIRRLQKCEWWNLPEQTLQENLKLFSGKLDEEKLLQIESICK